MSAANGRDFGRMTRGREPVVNRGADPAALHGRSTGTVVAGNQQEDTLAGGNRSLERAIDRVPGGIEAHSVQIEHPVGLGRV